MAYVALSRITSLNGLHLIDIDRSKIKCDQKVIVEYNRLRGIYLPHLGDLAIATDNQPTNKRTPTQKTATRKRQPGDELNI